MVLQWADFKKEKKASEENSSHNPYIYEILPGLMKYEKIYKLFRLVLNSSAQAPSVLAS
jgi:hypothetical protein